jgi:hypothetical protein
MALAPDPSAIIRQHRKPIETRSNAMFNSASAATGRIRKILAAGAMTAALTCAPAAMADWYFGANTGPMMIDTAGVGDPTNAGVVIGREWGMVVGDVGVQGELTTSINKGKFAGNDVSVDTQAIYGVFRSAGPIYLIAKAGVLREEVKIGPLSDSESGSSLGLGVGFSVGVAQLELEYPQIEKDIAYLSLGVRF